MSQFAAGSFSSLGHSALRPSEPPLIFSMHTHLGAIPWPGFFRSDRRSTSTGPSSGLLPDRKCGPRPRRRYGNNSPQAAFHLIQSRPATSDATNIGVCNLEAAAGRLCCTSPSIIRFGVPKPILICDRGRAAPDIRATYPAWKPASTRILQLMNRTPIYLAKRLW